VIALRCLGYRDDSPEMRYCLEQLESLTIYEGDTARLQPCKSPVWDTALTLRALAASGPTAEDPSVHRAVEWLLSKEVTRAGDWARSVPAEPGGWCFEYANEFYPDMDDTTMVMMALREAFDIQPGALPGLLIGGAKVPVAGALGHVARLDRVLSASGRGREWLLAMQNRDGGWGAFDKDNDCEFLCRVPFADHNAMIDPSTPDITARVLECLGGWGMRQEDPAVDRALAYLRRTQESDGSWYGRWGVNYIYGAWQVLVGLTAVGVPTSDAAVRRGAQWLLSKQQACGGWGESPDSYADPSLAGCGPVTASQTAWAILGLIAAGHARHEAVTRGVKYLLGAQRRDGTWDEPEFTGTGFPRVFYLRYHYYPIYFPLLALAAWRGAINR
jgi:squalene-hopene/tetraprenyl-beta-curcumene cyclase